MFLKVFFFTIKKTSLPKWAVLELIAPFASYQTDSTSGWLQPVQIGGQQISLQLGIQVLFMETKIKSGKTICHAFSFLKNICEYNYMDILKIPGEILFLFIF